MSDASRRLAQAHRLTQARIGALTVVQMHAIWRLLDPKALDGTFQDWLTAARPIVATSRATSARTASAYLTASKTLQLGTGTRTVVVPATLADEKALTTSLLVTGPVSIKRAMLRGNLLDRAIDLAEAASAAAAMRYALEGGRDMILDTVRADPQATGWERVASGNACAFCTELDGKFHRDDTADFPAHDGCTCTQEPVYAA